MTSNSLSFCSSVSILLITSTPGTFSAFIRSISCNSGAPGLGMGSTTNTAASTSVMLARTTPSMYSPSRFRAL